LINRKEILNRRARRDLENASKPTRQRYWWMVFVKLTTWWIPTWTIKYLGGMKNPDVITAWREKVALNVVMLLCSAAMLWLILGFSKALCPTQEVKTMLDLTTNANANGRIWVTFNGGVYDATDYKEHPVRLIINSLIKEQYRSNHSPSKRV
jgi:chitin synthase